MIFGLHQLADNEFADSFIEIETLVVRFKDSHGPKVAELQPVKFYVVNGTTTDLV